MRHKNLSLPIRTVPEDIDAICSYLSKKPTGATAADAKKVLDPKFLDGRKLSALKTWGLIEDSAGRLRVTDQGRLYATGDSVKKKQVLSSMIRRVEPYFAVVERAVHRNEESITAVDLAAHWHEHFAADAGDSDKTLNDQAVCFFQVASSAGLGEIVIGRRGNSTRMQFDMAVIKLLVDSGAESSVVPVVQKQINTHGLPTDEPIEEEEDIQKAGAGNAQLGQGIFVAHGKNKKPLEQLKRILDQFKIPYRVAVEEPNLGRPIGAKVKEIMESCNCAVLIFTADEEFIKGDGTSVWRPSENVVYELGASSYLYSNRIVIVKEKDVEFPTNFRDLGYISFDKDNLEAKSMDVLRELIGFGIVKVST
jgi:predicted nucleotide-binding protein